MASNDNNKRKGGGETTIWDIIANYALLWEILILGTIITVVLLDELKYYG